MTVAAFDRAVAAVRAAVAGIAVAVALLLLIHLPLVATFRAAVIVLGALEVLFSGRRMLSGAGWAREGSALAVKAFVLAGAYVALGS